MNYKDSRAERKFVEDHELHMVKPLDAVPTARDSSWTKGTLAWKRGATSTDMEVVGWWVAPRKRQKKTRSYKVKNTISPFEMAKLRTERPKRDRTAMLEERAKKNVRILRSSGYSMIEARLISQGLMGLDRQPILQEIPEFPASDVIGDDEE